MSRQYWQETLFVSTSDGTIISATTTETIIFPNITIPANYMSDGRTLELIAYGRHTAASTPTLTFRVRWGGVTGTVLCASGAMVTGTVTAGMWRVVVHLVTRANGSSGSIFATGSAKINEDATQTVGSATLAGVEDFMGSAGVATPAAVTVDLTADTALSLTAQFGTAGSNTLTGHTEILKSLN
jgi:hypothetical protein